MKNTLFLCLLSMLFLISCEKEPVNPPFHIAQNATVKIKPSGLKSASVLHLTDKEIVKQCILISFYNIAIYGNQATNIGFSESQRDTVSNPPYLKRWATDLLNDAGSEGVYYLVPDLITATDIVYCRVVNNKRDTIAYTPNSVMKQMEIEIKAALAAQDTTLAYNVFNDGMRFTPITGAEWRALKALGQQ